MSNSLVLGLKNYLSTGKFSDLTITCDAKEFNVHKIVIGAASPVLHNLLDGGFKEAIENKNVIELKDDPEALQALIHYLYHFVYCDSFIEGNRIISFAVKVYAIADKYQIEGLQALAAERFKKVCHPQRDIDDFIATIAFIEENTNPKDRTLWNIILSSIKDNITYLLTLKQFQRLLFEQKDLCLSLLGLLAPSNVASSPPQSLGRLQRAMGGGGWLWYGDEDVSSMEVVD